ncbi:MAG: hypothetical protein DIZ80_02325 [endosymbiont of Galathealinum brachiosum]|uniref:Uncharacterized protein n=1 Tax=endosymbiont of Galathealinum brachiosum TaxID=2200906 RepID=A0A370DK91_9GAMM|nr:MAG: hypothetical protein DIZ80_02325 [endosymbiont of Galathealinum brachiosum]
MFRLYIKMKILKLLLLCSIVFSTGMSAVNAEPDSSIDIKKPPVVLAKWYKPENKRQVWLHTMFKLRREMQAMREYAGQEDEVHMRKWLANFEKHYNKISEMVPEWEDKIKPELVSSVRKHAQNKDFYNVAITLNKIRETCDNCHDDYQPQVTAIYRSPDYSDLKINDVDGEPQNIENNMQDLSMYVNRILISLADGNNQAALNTTQNFKQQLKNLRSSCQSCHKDDEYPQERILGEATSNRIKSLEKNIKLGHIKESQKLMGEIAVTVCARCHNTHRIVYDLRESLLPEKKK